jgi:hypothetical protein
MQITNARPRYCISWNAGAVRWRASPVAGAGFLTGAAVGALGGPFGVGKLGGDACQIYAHVCAEHSTDWIVVSQPRHAEQTMVRNFGIRRPIRHNDRAPVWPILIVAFLAIGMINAAIFLRHR